MDGGQRSKHLKAKNNASRNKREAFIPPISSPHVEGSRKDAATNLDIIGLSSANIPDSSDALSSFSSDSSSDDFIQVNPQALLKSTARNNIPKPNVGKKPAYKNHHVDVLSEALYKLEESIDSPGSTSQFLDITHESLVPRVLLTQSPPIQMMERAGAFDPSRIPAAVFSKSPTPTDWSAASNDSLFSIQIGNNSFNRDHALKIGMDLQSSGELPKSEEFFEFKELYRSGEHHKSGDLHQSKGVKPSQNVGMAKNTDDERNPRATVTFIEPANDVSRADINNHVDKNLGNARDSSIANHQSNESETVIQIPCIKKKKSSCPLCHCSDCYRAFYCCKWLSCCCKWPDCRCKLSACSCKWLSCSGCSCKWFSWSSCSCKWFSLFSCSCKWFSLSSCSCKWFSCSSCSRNCLSRKSCFCKWPKSCSKWPKSCCKWPKSCCKWPSCNWKCSWSSCNCKCPTWPSCSCTCPKWSSCCCNCHFPKCKWECCSCWNSKSKKSSSMEDTEISSPKKGFHEDSLPTNSVKSSSRGRYSCFSSSCSCCSCCSFSCCC